MRDRRGDSVWVLLLRGLVFLVAATVAIGFFRSAATLYGDPTTGLSRFRQPAAPLPHVLVKGTLARDANKDLPALAFVEHERLVPSGKTPTWMTEQSFHYANAVVNVTWSSSPLPSQVKLDSSFKAMPWAFDVDFAKPDRIAAWIAYAARTTDIGFDMPTRPSDDERVAEFIADTGTPVTISACVSATKPGFLEKCPGMPDYGIIANGDTGVACDDGADDIAQLIGLGMAALLVAVVAWVRPKKDLAEGLENRAEKHRRTLGWAWALLAVPVVGWIVDWRLGALQPPSTWATGRGGFIFAISVMAAWLFYAMTRLLRRKSMLAALGPVLATPRKTLAEANGTVELSVKAKLRNGGVRAFIGDDVVAYSEVTIWERYKKGKTTLKELLLVSRQRNELGVVDESSEGTLDLQRGILDVEVRKETCEVLPLHYGKRGVVAHGHVGHVKYYVEERVIKDGDSLFVLGDVSGIAVQSGEGSYRAIRGSPTLGGADAAPVLVYAGSQKGLVEMLTREASVANVFAVVAIGLCGVMALSLGALAML